SSCASMSPDDPCRPRVLVVDDTPENRRLFYFYLRREYDVADAASGEEALAALRALPADAVLLDLTLGAGMSGLETLAALRAEAALAHLPVLALTAHASPADRARCLAAGFDAYLSKPVLRGALLQAVADLLAPTPPHR
ncbi:MAG: response regulator, partial [Rubricoccaceae bacterium]